MEILKADRVKTVVIAFDNDEPGARPPRARRPGSVAEGFSVKRIFPHVQGLERGPPGRCGGFCNQGQDRRGPADRAAEALA